MLKYLFPALMVIHGLIHLLGFAKAFHLGKISQLTRYISRFEGILWLLAALGFSATFVFRLLDNEYWPLLCLLTVALSQVLIIFSWPDAKFGTLANFIIFLVVLPVFSARQFERMVRTEQQAFVSRLSPASKEVVTENELSTLPAVVQKWMRTSGVVGKPRVTSIRLKQKGKIMMEQDSKSADFIAAQYINPVQPAFIWNTSFYLKPGILIQGRDKFEDGEGEMLIKLLSIINIVDEKNTEGLNSGSAIRYLAEMCWYPSAALSSYVTWQQVDSLHAIAHLKTGEQKVQGLFSFRPNGEVEGFEAERYFGVGKDAKKEPWVISHKRYREFNGLRIPYQSSVTWKLKGGDFTWLEMEISEIVFDKPGLF